MKKFYNLQTRLTSSLSTTGSLFSVIFSFCAFEATPEAGLFSDCIESMPSFSLGK